LYLGLAILLLGRWRGKLDQGDAPPKSGEPHQTDNPAFPAGLLVCDKLCPHVVTYGLFNSSTRSIA